MSDSYIPIRPGEDFEERFRDTQLATDFRLVAELTERCSPKSEQCLLLLTTCRNHLLTVNAVFVDVREIVGAATLPSPLGRAAHSYDIQDWKDAEKALREVREVLSIGKDKLDVWNERQSLSDRISAALQEFGQVDRDRLRSLLGLNRERLGVPLVYRPTDYDTAVTAPHAVDLLDALRRHVQAIHAISGLALRLAVALQLGSAADAKHEGQLFEIPDQAVERDRALDGVLAILASDPWGGVPAHGGRMISLPGHGEFDLDVGSDLTSLASLVGRRLAEVASDIRDDLRREFLPNVVAPPMPAPFVVDLSAPVHAAEQSLEVNRVDCLGPPVSGNARVALLRCGIPEDWYLPDDAAYQFVPSKVDLMVDVVRNAIRTAADAGAKMVVLPEVFMPAAAVEPAVQLATERAIIVVGGVEMHRQSGVVNRAIVALPNGMHQQRKQRPSVYEVRQAEFAGDGVIQVFTGTSVGSFAVVICSDLLEHDVIGAIESAAHVGLVVVCSRNPNFEVFAHLAAADSYRHYLNVVVSNACPGAGSESPSSGEGTLAVSPLRSNPFLNAVDSIELGLVEEFAPHEAPSLALFDISLDAIAHRKNNRPDHGYLSPSHFARR